MRDLHHRILSALVMLSLTGAVAAAGSTFKKELDFTTGGHTIGGPGIFETKTGESELVFFILPDTPRPSKCVTVANIGETSLQIVFDFSFPHTVDAGKTATRCSAGFSIHLSCTGAPSSPRGATCEALWRVDEYR